MSRLVVDASVAVKWYLPEIHAQAARNLLETASGFTVPGLFFAEVGNALWKRWSIGRLALDDLADTLEALNLVPFEVQPTRSLLRPGMAIAMRHRCTVYDSLYLALAVQQNTRMITADRRFYRAVAEGPLADHIAWVEEAP